MAQKLTSKSVQSIMQKRALVKESHVGKSIVLTIQGNGNVIDVKNKEGELVQSVVEPGVVLQKTIFNAKANSAIAMANPINQQLLKDGLAAERAGETDKAHEMYSAYLNAVQLSLGILHPNPKLDQIADSVEVAGKIEKITTDNGSLLTVDASTIRVKEPETLGSTNFDISAFLGEDAATEETVETPAEVTAEEAITA